MRTLALKVLLRSFALLPLPVAHGLGTVIGWLAYLIPNDLRRVTWINLGLCLPEREPRNRRRLARRSLAETGKTVTEMGAMWFWGRNRLRGKVRDVRGWPVMEEALARGQGVIALTPHLGAWELTSLYFSGEFPLTCLYRPPRLKGLEEMILRSRQRMGTRLVPASAAGVKQLYAALDRGENVGVLPDQDPGPHAGVFAPFFGVPASTMVLVPRLVQRTGATVVFVYAERLRRGRGYILHFHAAPPGIYELDTVTAATALNRGVEECVRQLPTQYQWSYKRFKTRPKGEPSLYKKA